MGVSSSNYKRDRGVREMLRLMFSANYGEPRPKRGGGWCWVFSFAKRIQGWNLGVLVVSKRVVLFKC